MRTLTAPLMKICMDDNFYMPGEADGISSRQYSPSPPAFLYPILSPIGFPSPSFVTLPNFELCEGVFGFLRVPQDSKELHRVP